MKKIGISLFCVVCLSFFVVDQVEARQGCCSHHGGVCGCGCCDGTPLSAKCRPYYNDVCGGSSYVPSTPKPVYKSTPIPTIAPAIVVPTKKPKPKATPTPTSTPLPSPTPSPTPTPIPTSEATPSPKPTTKSENTEEGSGEVAGATDEASALDWVKGTGLLGVLGYGVVKFFPSKRSLSPD